MSSYFISNFLSVLNNEQFDNKIAIQSIDNQLTYKEVKSYVYNISTELSKYKKGNPLVGLFTETDARVYASILGVVVSGKAYVPLSSSHPIDRISQIITLSELDIILSHTEHPLLEEIQKLFPSIKIIYIDNLEKSSELSADLQVDRNRLAYLLFTSGSTGTPKGVPIYLRNLDSYIRTLVEGKYGFNKEERIMQMFDLTFDFSIFPIFLNFALGATLVDVSKKGVKPLKVFETLEDHNITVAAMVPSVISYLKPFFEEITLPDLKCNVFCGEALYHEIMEGWANCCPNATSYNFYGPTEATVFCLEYIWDKEVSKKESVNGIVPIGKSMRSTTVCVVDENNNILSGSSKGELCLMGEQVTNKYWKNETKTKASFITLEMDGSLVPAYKTGDIAYLNENGNYIFCGRADSQVKVDGYRIELAEIEHAIKVVTKNDTVACIAAKNKNNSHLIYSFVEGEEMSDVKKLLKKQLPVYMIPSEIFFIKKMPLNSNGKIDRKKLHELI